ncbi:MAG: hypothetical protein NTW55_05930 [Planctomycetota bacterium]|nr:hypothetical protein [Planctomycetota bacterium]
MFEVIKYRMQLQKLERQCNKIKKGYLKDRKGLSGDKLEELDSEEYSEVIPILGEIATIKTQRFCQIANRLMIPLPDIQDKELWEDNPYVRTRTLSAKGFSELRKSIRQEKKEIREGFVVWLAALTGVIGAITGLAAVLSR